MHISGSLNVDAMLQDLIGLGAAVPEASSAGVPFEEQVQQIADAISEASFDLYSVVDDCILRGVDFNLAVDPERDSGCRGGPAWRASTPTSLRLASVNESRRSRRPATPSRSRSCSGSSGSTRALRRGSAGRRLGGAGGGLPGGGGGGGGAAGGNADAYLDCIAEAQTPDEINACASQL